MQNETINSRFFALRMSHMSLLLFFCTIFFGIFFLSGCSDSPKSYSLSDFMAEDQSFAYPELSWVSSLIMENYGLPVFLLRILYRTIKALCRIFQIWLRKQEEYGEQKVKLSKTALFQIPKLRLSHIYIPHISGNMMMKTVKRWQSFLLFTFRKASIIYLLISASR